MRSLLAALFLFLFVNVFAQEKKLKISPLTKNAFVFTTWQVFDGTPFPSNGMYVLTNDGVVMIDTPWDTTQFQPLLDSIAKRHNKNVSLVIATHSHKDRTGGLAYYQSKDIPCYTTMLTDQVSKTKGEHRAKKLIVNDTVFNVGGTKFQTYYAGKGHTADNIVVYFEKEKILYGGCLVKSTEANDLGNISEADLKAYPKTVRRVQEKFRNAKFVVPGHQSWSNKNSLEHTLQLLNKQSISDVNVVIESPSVEQVAILPGDFDQLIKKEWTGVLTYLDYTTKKQVTIPANLQVSSGEKQFFFKNIYPEEPQANSIDTLTIKNEGSFINDLEVMNRSFISDSITTIIAQKIEKNNNKETIYLYTYRITPGTFSIRKEECVLPGIEFIERFRYEYHL